MRLLFTDSVQEQVSRHVASSGLDDAAGYLVDLLMDFMRTDRLYAIRDECGVPVTSVIELLAEGDVMLNADSFERERLVHQYIGDFILFWSGVHPAYLSRVKIGHPLDLVCDYADQGRKSYRLVAMFDQGERVLEAQTFQKLSEGFDDFTFVLSQVARQTGIYGRCA